MSTKLVLFLFFAAFWVMLSGHFTPFLLLLGLGSIVLVLILSSRLGLINKKLSFTTSVIRLTHYSLWLLWQMIRSHITVTHLILKRQLTINPQFVQTSCQQKKNLGKMVYANSVTLTPGTISTDIDGDTLEIHVLTYTPDSLKSLEEFNYRVAQLEARD